jgi:ornithine cyclodeaminase/alanine dehydrogenase-like protein (mu-crystallin family)
MLKIEEGKRYLGIMPAVMQEAMGVKLVSLYPGNAGTGLPTHFGIILLSRSDTGEPLAVMDGRLITGMRTAAVSAAVTKHLAAPESQVLALLGSGVQASAHWNALSRVRQFDDIRIWSRKPEHAQRFADEHDIRAMASVESAVRNANVIVTAMLAGLLIGIGTDDHVKMPVANSFPPLPRQRSRDTLASQRFRHRAI